MFILCRSSHTKWATVVTENMSAYKPDNKAKINWSKYESQAKIIRSVAAYQKRFDTCDSHAFPERPVIRHILEDTPNLPREVRNESLTLNGRGVELIDFV